jgi:D-aminopeptidase
MRYLIIILALATCLNMEAQKKRAADYGIRIGILNPGRNNAITDVPGVKVGHMTIREPDSVNTGVTAILPHGGNLFRNKVPAAIFVGNGFGKLTGYTQVEELGNIETPVILTSTLSVPTAADAVIEYTLRQPGNGMITSVNPVVGETNDAGLNDPRLKAVTRELVIQAINSADTGIVPEGNVGAGTGTVCFGFKGGIGTSSRVLPRPRGGYTVGVLVQTNFGGILQIDGVPVGSELGKYKFSKVPEEYKEDGSCMVVIMTDAPLDPRNLKRLASRAVSGIARTGGMTSNSSGDYAIAVSTYEKNRIPYASGDRIQVIDNLRNEEMDLLFEAVIESTEEAIVNSLFAAESVTGRHNFRIEALPVDETIRIMKQYNRIR